MPSTIKINQSILWPLVVLIIALAAFILKPWGTKTQETISVTAEGRAQSTPDVANITASIISQNQDVEIARKDNETRVTKILERLKELGVEEKDIKTQNVSSGPDYQIQPFPAPTKPDTNQFTTSLEVTVRNFENTDEVIAALTQQGVSNLYGPSLTLSDEKFEEAKSQARTKAAENAKKKAEELATTAQRKVGKVTSIKELSDYGFPVPLVAQSEADLRQKANVVQPGQNDVTISLQIDFSLK